MIALTTDLKRLGDVKAPAQVARRQALAEEVDGLAAGELVDDRLDDARSLSRDVADLSTQPRTRQPAQPGDHHYHGRKHAERDQSAAEPGTYLQLVDDGAEDVRQDAGDDEWR